ncbi:MAG: UDP-N-acetylmuramate--L-alanine ligase [Bacteroidetes bacterium]|nr:UDP-N-acetylmuramate--L-alanine ligase [Bacteroidota bacterium]
MNPFEHIKQVYFLGIGGIGMSALARYFKQVGMTVAGYDKTPTLLTQTLEKEGMEVIYTDNPDLLPHWLGSYPPSSLVVYTPAIPATLQLAAAIKSLGHEPIKRAQALAMCTLGTQTIAVAGTHGKTTTTTYLAHLFHCANKPFRAFLGGISSNYGSNFISKTGNGACFSIVEADEYDRSFLTLRPSIAIVTSCEPDHLDIYGDFDALLSSYNLFINQVVENGHLVLHESLEGKFQIRPDIKVTFFGQTKGAQITNLQVRQGQYVFDLKPLELFGLRNGLPGLHNALNATAAIAASHHLLPRHDIAAAVESFKGIHRRFQTICSSAHYAYIDDYAHHPTELQAAISTAKLLYPDRPLTVVFQPHLYSRTRDLAAGFKEVLSQADSLIIMPIYPARELPIPGVGAEMIRPQAATPILTHAEVLRYIAGQRPALLLTVGAGDIDLLPTQIKEIYEHGSE